MSKQRNLRKKRALSEEADEQPSGAPDAAPGPSGAEEAAPELLRDNLEDIKLLQRQRKRLAGVRADALATRTGAGGAAAAGAGADSDNELMESYVREQSRGRVLDEEAHMQKFIETELAKRLGKRVEDGEGQLSRQEQDEQELYAVPQGLQAQLKQEVVIPGLMTAITEVEVSREDKLRKIEETEAFKRRMLATSKSGADGSVAVDDEQAGSGALRRGDFVFSFGKQQKQQPVMKDGVKVPARKTISEHRSGGRPEIKR